jgi:hypothetical protein
MRGAGYKDGQQRKGTEKEGQNGEQAYFNRKLRKQDQGHRGDPLYPEDTIHIQNQRHHRLILDTEYCL